MEYLRKVDFSAFPPDRFSWQVLAETERCIIVIVRQPADVNTPRRKPHYHRADQVFYMLDGSLEIDLNGKKHRADRDSTIFIPAGTVHSHVALQDELHLDIISPAPTRGMPLSRIQDDEQVYREMPDNPQSPAVVVTPGKPLQQPWVRTLADVSMRPTHVPGFDVRTVINRAAGSEHIFIDIVEVQPGPRPGWRIHNFDQFSYVLDGTLTVEIANQSYEVLPHQLIVVPAGVPYRNWNNGTTVERHLRILQPEPQPGIPMDYEVTFGVTGAAS